MGWLLKCRVTQVSYRLLFFVQVDSASSIISVSWYVWNTRNGAKCCVFSLLALRARKIRIQISEAGSVFPQVKNPCVILVNSLHML